MTKIYGPSIAGIAVFFVALSMHQLRVHQFESISTFLFILLYVTGMVAALNFQSFFKKQGINE